MKPNRCALFLVMPLVLLLTGTSAAQDTPSSTDALNVVEACARLNNAGRAFTRFQEEGGTDSDFAKIPGVSVLAAMVNHHAHRTGFTAEDCMIYDGAPEVMDALQGIAQSGKLVVKEGHNTGPETPKMKWCLNISLTNCLSLTREQVATIPQTLVSCSRSDGDTLDVNKPDTFLMIDWLSQDLPSDTFRCDPYG